MAATLKAPTGATQTKSYALPVLTAQPNANFTTESFTPTDMVAMGIIVNGKVSANTNGNLYLQTKNAEGARTAAIYLSKGARKGVKVGDVLSKDNILFYYIDTLADGTSLEGQPDVNGNPMLPYFVAGLNGNGGEFVDFQ